ncbi:signal recognition particle, SRP9/SRP14 subunit [Gigaspora margarita]|uniref:Signal recognition particle 9 kDa protein n=1 Tax=Gigaspora margarita TaxID=4874 RepID=A0A8H4A572_GIGMA|nr:signal recognition particle, SRP9/SRP14 subunit [Gigaspora margarita]
MVYINDWNEYQQAVEQLYLDSPKETRYVTSWKHSQGKLVLKVTDNFKALKYKTDQAADLKRFERLNRSLMLKMQNRSEPSEGEATTSSTPVSLSQHSHTPEPTSTVASAAESPANTTTTGKAQPSSKKKGKKGR